MLESQNHPVCDPNMLDLNTSPAALTLRNMPMANLAKGAECRESTSPPFQEKTFS
jgi:hypothetical protein